MGLRDDKRRAADEVQRQDRAVAEELTKRKMLCHDGDRPATWLVVVGIGKQLAVGRSPFPPRTQMQRLYDLVVDLLGAREDRARLRAENERMRAAILPLLENVERWNEGGEPASAEQSRAMYLALCESIGREPRV